MAKKSREYVPPKERGKLKKILKELQVKDPVQYFDEHGNPAGGEIFGDPVTMEIPCQLQDYEI